MGLSVRVQLWLKAIRNFSGATYATIADRQLVIVRARKCGFPEAVGKFLARS